MHARRTSHWVRIASLLVIVAGAVWIRWPGFTQGGFASHDVAGILYNAMLLHAGGLPYVDSLELKSPGTFYLAALLAGDGGRDIGQFQVWANVWGVLTLMAVGVIGWRLWGAQSGVISAVLYGLHDAYLDTMDANYVTWAQGPQVVAIGLALEAARTRRARRALVLWALAGALAGTATLLKQPAATGLVLVLVGAAVERRQPLATATRVFTVALGASLVHLPVVAHYAFSGHLGDLLTGYLFNDWAVAYLERQIDGFWPWEGMGATVFFLALPFALAAYAVGRGAVEGLDRPMLWLLGWTIASLIAAWAGFRFYKGYFLAVAPPLCLLAASPFSLLLARGNRPLRMLLLIPVILLLVRQLELIHDTRSDRARPHDLGARRIAAHLGPSLQPGDRIWVWGWHLWDLYPLTGNLSGSRIYKSLGLLTLPNDDTWRYPQSELRFRDGPLAKQLLSDLRTSRPRFVVLGSTVPHQRFRALHRFLDAHYVQDHEFRLGRVQIWRLRPESDHAPLTKPDLPSGD